MKIAVSAGHNVYIGNNFDPGSLGNGLREGDITKETVRLLIPMLKNLGHAVLDVTPYDQKFRHSRDAHVLRCKRADDFGADLFIDVHVNASTGKGTGVECWVHDMNSKSVPYATRICQSISNLGLYNRGVKANSNYWTTSLSKSPAIIIEGGFIDNINDMKILTPSNYARAIAEGIAGKKNEKENDIMTREEVVKIVREEVLKAIRPGTEKENHWAKESYDNLVNRGIEIHDKRFDDLVTRGELFALEDRILESVYKKIENIK